MMMTARITLRRAVAGGLLLAGGALIAYVLRAGPEDLGRRIALLALVVTGIGLCLTGLIRVQLPIRLVVRVIALGCTAILWGATLALGQAIDTRVVQFVPREDTGLRAELAEWRRTVAVLVWITAYLTASVAVLPGPARKQS